MLRLTVTSESDLWFSIYGSSISSLHACPATGFGVGGGVRRSGPHGEVRGILISVLGHSGPSLYGSGAGRVSIARLAEAPFTRAPRRSAATERGVLRPDQGHGGHARSSPTQSACDEEPGSPRPPGGRVAAWDPNLQIYHDFVHFSFSLKYWKIA